MRSGSGLTIRDMARSVRYHPHFDSDVLAAADWYDQRQFGLGSDFLVRVRNATFAFLADPWRRTATDYGLRYWPVEKYPYVVFYDLTDTEVIVLSVMHTSQQQEKWIARRGSS